MITLQKSNSFFYFEKKKLTLHVKNHAFFANFEAIFFEYIFQYTIKSSSQESFFCYNKLHNKE